RLDNNELPDKTSKNILERVSKKFNQTLDQVGILFGRMEKKLSASEQEIKAKQETINSLNDELEHLRNLFLEDNPQTIQTPEVNRLKYQLINTNSTNLSLQRKLIDWEQNHHKKLLSELEKVKAQEDKKYL